MNRFILSIDGGGVKNIFSAFVLKDLEEKIRLLENNKKACLADYFDLIAGTSSGAILAAFYLVPQADGRAMFDAAKILELYKQFGPLAFKKQCGYPFFGAKYTNAYLKQFLDEYLGEKTLSYLIKPCLITAYDMKSGKAIFFNSVTARKEECRNIRIQDAVLASCSAPTYFPPVTLTDCKNTGFCLVDGGVVANNPALCALIEMMKQRDTKKISDITVVSFGNVSKRTSFQCENVKKWGLFQWPGAMLDIFMDGSEQTVHYQIQRIFQSVGCPQQYYRLEAIMQEEPPKLSDFSKSTIKKLEKLAMDYTEKEAYNLNCLAKKLVTHRQKEKNNQLS